MAIAHRDTRVAALTAAGTSLSVPRPTLEAGDVVVVHAFNAGAAANPSTVPAGFTLAHAQDNAGVTRRTSVYLKRVDDPASEPTSYAFAWAASAEHLLIASAFSGVDPTTPLDVTPVGQGNSATVHDVPSQTPATAPTLLVASYFTGDTTTIAWPTGMAELGQADSRASASTSGRSASVALQPITSAGAPTGTRTVTPGTADGNSTTGLLLRTYVAPPPPPVDTGPLPRPTLTDVAERVYGQVEQLAPTDQQHGWAMAHVAGALATMLDRLYGYAHDAEAPWGSLFDAEQAPDEALEHVGQYVGVQLPGNLDAAARRIRVRETDGQRRGTLAALVGAAKQHLTGTRRVEIVERDGSAYRFTVTTYTAETPDPARVRAALDEQKPAGLVLTYHVRDGQTYAQAQAAHATYDAGRLAYHTYDDAANKLPAA